MGFLGRMLFATQGVIAVAVLGITYAAVAAPIINMVRNRGGPFTEVVDQLESVVPLLIALLLLFIVVWFVISGARQERARNQRRRPPL